MLQIFKFLNLSKIICSILFLLQVQSIHAEPSSTDDEDSVQKTSYSLKPSALNIGIDVFTPVYSYIRYGTNFHYYCGHVSIDINRIFIDCDLGFLKSHKVQPGSLPEEFQPVKNGSSSAQQFDNLTQQFNAKIGFSYNFLHKNKKHHSIFFGVGYNFNFCNDRLNGKLYERGGTPAPEIIETNSQSFFYNWMDVSLGLRVTLFNNFYVGHTSHLNILNHCLKGKNSCLIPYYIAGYGKEENHAEYKFDFFIGYNIPLWKDPKVEAKDL